MIFQVTKDGICSPQPTPAESAVLGTIELMEAQAETVTTLNESGEFDLRDLAYIGIISSSALCIAMAILAVARSLQEK